MEKSRFNAAMSAKLGDLIKNSSAELFPTLEDSDSRKNKKAKWIEITKELNETFAHFGVRFRIDQVKEHWKYLRCRAKGRSAANRRLANTIDAQKIVKSNNVIEYPAYHLSAQTPVNASTLNGSVPTQNEDLSIKTARVWTPPVASAVLDDVSRRGQKRSYPSVDIIPVSSQLSLCYPSVLPSSSKQTFPTQAEVLQLKKEVLLKDNENADRMKVVLEQASQFFSLGIKLLSGFVPDAENITRQTNNSSINSTLGIDAEREKEPESVPNTQNGIIDPSMKIKAEVPSEQSETNSTIIDVFKQLQGSFQNY
ncbi:myb/SANT-like DNA-binding domain-containing protein [Ditylenchus destructor]|nr:myb/SANT-like DNA-binding domain-containing protein [Ditylenchus destructor]